jgi:hypothetical protein
MAGPGIPACFAAIIRAYRERRPPPRVRKPWFRSLHRDTQRDTRDHSGLMPANFTTLAHFSDSAAT